MDLVVPQDTGRTLSPGSQPLNAPSCSFWNNACVYAPAHRILVRHTAQGSKTEALCQQALAAAKPVYTLPSTHNAHLIALGAQPIPPDDPSALLSA